MRTIILIRQDKVSVMLIVLVLVGRTARSELANVPAPVFLVASRTGNGLVVTLPVKALSLDPL